VENVEFIIGVIDNHGQILSKGFGSIVKSYAIETHWKYWEERHKRWRWNQKEGLHSINPMDITDVEWEDIAYHCKKYYNVWGEKVGKS